MNEAIVNEMTAISELNRVDGFDPSRFMRKLIELCVKHGFEVKRLK